MMLLSIITLIISFLLQGISSNYLGFSLEHMSWLLTIYPLVNLLILVPYFENKKKYFTLMIIFGIIIDITYTNTIILNTSVFILAYYFSKFFHFFFPYNLFTINISNILSIFLYHITCFIFLIIVNYDSYTFMTLLKILSHSILMTIMYSSIIYLLIRYINQKFDLKEIK